MPNWCSNKLTLTHSEPGKINFAITAFKDKKLCETFVPLPNNQWDYDFCVSKWGTKWDVGGDDDEVVIQGPNTAVFYFDSAWAPPIGLYQTLCAQGYEVEALYDEPGMQFCGKFVGNNQDDYDDYIEYGSESADSVRDLVGHELDEYFAISDRMREFDDVDDDDTNELIDELERIRNIGPHTD